LLADFIRFCKYLEGNTQNIYLGKSRFHKNLSINVRHENIVDKIQFFVVLNVLEISKESRRTKSTETRAYADDMTIMSRSEVARAVLNDEHLCCGKYKFEHIKEFSYLGSQMNQTNSISSEIQARILSGNRCYCVYGKLMKPRALN